MSPTKTARTSPGGASRRNAATQKRARRDRAELRSARARAESVARELLAFPSRCSAGLLEQKALELGRAASALQSAAHWVSRGGA